MAMAIRGNMQKINSSWWGTFFKDRAFFTSMFSIMIPIALQNLLINGLNFADTLMIGQLGEAEIAAVGLANQIFFLFMLTLFGIGSASAIFVAQFWGKKDIQAIRRTQGLCFTLAMVPTVIFTLAALIIPEFLLSIFSKDREVIELGASYLRVVAFSYPLTAAGFSFGNILRSIERAKIPLYASVFALISNVILNYLFIFGIGPFPALGVVGAALGTTIARIMEVVFIFILIYKKPKPGEEVNPAAASWKEMTSFHIPFVKKYITVAAPVILNEMVWAFGMTIYKFVYARMGTADIAAVNIAEVVINLLFVLFFGSANAAAVMVGKAIGEGDKDKSYEYGLRFSVLGFILGIVVGALMILLSGAMVSFFSVSPEVKEAARWILIVVGFYTPFKVYNLHVVVGILRGGGDTKMSLVIDIIGVWIIGVPMALAGGLWWQYSVVVVYALVTSEEFVKSILCLYRLFSKKWINDLTAPPPETQYIQEWE